MTFVRRHPLVSFFVLAYGLSWAYWIPLALAGVRTAPGSSTTRCSSSMRGDDVAFAAKS